MFSKILLLLTDTHSDSAINWSIKLAQLFKARLYVLYIIEPSRKKKLATLTKRDLNLISKELEENGWQNLYMVEDQAFEKEVKTSLHYVDGLIFETVVEFIKDYGIQLLILNSGETAKKFAVASPVPVFIA
ncbi:MAG: universal stress protein [candidate division WOR-3 bacterium]